MIIETILSLVDLDVDDPYLNPMLKNILQLKYLHLHPSLETKPREGLLLKNQLELVMSMLPRLSTSQQLRVIDYLLFVGAEPPKISCSFKDALYSITILSLSLESLYEKTGICEEKLRILKKFVEIRDFASDPLLVDFLRKSVSENGTEEAHLDLLILLEFISRLRRKGYKAKLFNFYGLILLDTDADFPARVKISDEIVEEYKRRDVDVSNGVNYVLGIIYSKERLTEYLNKLKFTQQS